MTALLVRTDAPRKQSSQENMSDFISRFRTDRECISRQLGVPYSAAYWQRYTDFLELSRSQIVLIQYRSLDRSGRCDWQLLKGFIDAEMQWVESEKKRLDDALHLLPFAGRLTSLEHRRRRMEYVDSAFVAKELDFARQEVLKAQGELTIIAELPPSRFVYALEAVTSLLSTLSTWFSFYNGYDPLFTWWVEQPYTALVADLQKYSESLRNYISERDSIVGEPLGRLELERELEHAQVSYTPEELIAVAHDEMQWCLDELKAASREMGCGDDWLTALEKVKCDHVTPGQQTALVRDLALEAIAYVESNDLVTVPELAKECWQMEMMSAERQRINPFFTGGETISISFPTNKMDNAQKEMSLRGNNRSFARATVHHELIPGHHLQGYCQERYRPYRQLFTTPMWTEGWTLHWEMLLWKQGFARTPQEKIGMLFWRNHRCARVIFSLKFHLGQMTAQECVDMLVHDVGHEYANAEAEVRRSLESNYHPLYQLAYLVGGMQMHALHTELVISGRMSHKEFHDAVLHENCMPIPTLRALLNGDPFSMDFKPDWKFLETYSRV